ncbi:hypothetical protein JYU02_00880 [bacterium AH-315-P15]|nr:hypothetical protein [bacterium AH-315-P15]
MKPEFSPPIPFLFTRKGAIKSPDDLLHAHFVGYDLVEARGENRAVECRFVVLWLRLANGELIPAVTRPDLLPALADFLEAKEAGDAYEY